MPTVSKAACFAAFLAFLPAFSIARDATLGLKEAHLDKNGIFMGFLPAWGEQKSPNTATSLNALLPSPMASVGAYVQLSSKDPNITQMDNYVQDILNQPGDRPVFNLALMPAEGLAAVTQDVANLIAQRMAYLNSLGIPVWLRYAHEMNGDWYTYGQQPAAFIQSWEMVARAVHAAAPDTYMLWAPNEMYATNYDTGSVYGGYTPYWPDPDTVDMVGLSFYHYGGHARLNNYPTPGEALSVMSTFDGLFASAYNKSMVLAETGAAYTRDMDTGAVAPGNATESEIKWNWLWQLTGPETSEALPWLKAICWFEVIKDENAAGDTPVKEEDFRLLTGNATVALGARNYLIAPSTVTNRVVAGMTADSPTNLGGSNTSISSSNSASGGSGGDASSAVRLHNWTGAAVSTLIVSALAVALL